MTALTQIYELKLLTGWLYRHNLIEGEAYRMIADKADEVDTAIQKERKYGE